jgi:phosphoribosylglycinamide formyltransferase 1
VPLPPAPLRLVVLISGSGTLLQALIDACAAPDFGAQVVGVGADRDQITGLQRAESAGISTFVHPLVPGSDRAEWDRQLTELVAKFEPSLVVMAGFMKLVGPQFLATYGGRLINSHPALLPSFPGMQGPRDALAYGVKISGATTRSPYWLRMTTQSRICTSESRLLSATSSFRRCTGWRPGAGT